MPSPLRILLIEDHRDLAVLTAEFLRGNGCEVEIALNGGEGCRKAAQSRPDVVICDLRLPDLNGREVARVIRSELAPNSPVIIATTADDVSVLQKHVKQSPFDAYLAKPLDWHQFQKCVESLTRSPKSK